MRSFGKDTSMRTLFTLLAGLLLLGPTVAPSSAWAGSPAVEEVGTREAGKVSLYRVQVYAPAARKAEQLASQAACEYATDALLGDPDKSARAVASLGKDGCRALVARLETLSSRRSGSGTQYKMRVDFHNDKLRVALKKDGYDMVRDDLGPAVVVFAEFQRTWGGTTLVSEDQEPDFRIEILNHVQGELQGQGVQVLSQAAIHDALADARDRGELSSEYDDKTRRWIKRFSADHGAKTFLEIRVKPRDDEGGGGYHWTATVDAASLTSLMSLGSATARSAVIRRGEAPTVDLLKAAAAEAMRDIFRTISANGG
jgi:hypothetical protein